MNKGIYKALAIVCAMIGFAAISQTLRIWNSLATDIAPLFIYLLIMSFVMTFGIFWLANIFWKKGK